MVCLITQAWAGNLACGLGSHAARRCPMGASAHDDSLSRTLSVRDTLTSGQYGRGFAPRRGALCSTQVWAGYLACGLDARAIHNGGNQTSHALQWGAGQLAGSLGNLRHPRAAPATDGMPWLSSDRDLYGLVGRAPAQ